MNTPTSTPPQALPYHVYKYTSSDRKWQFIPRSLKWEITECEIFDIKAIASKDPYTDDDILVLREYLSNAFNEVNKELLDQIEAKTKDSHIIIYIQLCRNRIPTWSIQAAEPRKIPEQQTIDPETLKNIELITQEVVNVANFETTLLPYFAKRGPWFMELAGWRIPAWELLSKVMKRPDFEAVIRTILTQRQIEYKLFSINGHFDIKRFDVLFSKPLPDFIAQTLYASLVRSSELLKNSHEEEKHQKIRQYIWNQLASYEKRENLSYDRWKDVYPRYVFPTIFWNDIRW